MSVLELFAIFGAGYFLHWWKWFIMDGGIEKFLKSLEEVE